MAESEKMLAGLVVSSPVSRELNNPLSVVLGQSEQLVVDTAESEDINSGLRLINEQALRARHIVKDLLQFIRPRDDHREAVDLTFLAERVVAAQQNTAVVHGVTLTTDLPRRLPPVFADSAGLEQVIVNILDNAMDAAGSGGTVRVFGRAGNGRAEVVIEDSGPGMSEDILPHIFDPFFSTKPTGQGTGLGLAVSLGLVQQQGGALRVENRPAPGIGARFILALPIDPDAYGCSCPSSCCDAGTLHAIALCQSRCGELSEVMVIDDEAAVRLTTCAFFAAVAGCVPVFDR